VIRTDEHLKIVRIVNYRPENIEEFVKEIYSYDYAPFHHLEAKTRYLLSTTNELLVIFVHNIDVKEVLRGSGAFRHVECDRIRAVKDAIRDLWNPRQNGERTEDHVIHASDNETQTDHMLRNIGVRKGLAVLRRKPNELLDSPYHISAFPTFTVKSIPVHKIECSITMRESGEDDYQRRNCQLSESPHHACLAGDTETYGRYLSERRGRVLCDDYSLQGFLDLQKDLRYLEPPNGSAYILTHYQPETDRYLILDGLHRASILAHRGQENITVAVVQPYNRG